MGQRFFTSGRFKIGIATFLDPDNAYLVCRRLGGRAPWCYDFLRILEIKEDCPCILRSIFWSPGG